MLSYRKEGGSMEKSILDMDSANEVVSHEAISLPDEDVKEFLSFLEDKEDYLDTGLGAFHTDDHSNW